MLRLLLRFRPGRPVCGINCVRDRVSLLIECVPLSVSNYLLPRPLPVGAALAVVPRAAVARRAAGVGGRAHDLRGCGGAAACRLRHHRAGWLVGWLVGWWDAVVSE